tara:strand:+ start:297 stop:989 length:693 start_codon:yes stop_codon:yes gene_type:complete
MILEKNIYINDDDYVIQKMLSTDWFEISKKEYTDIVFRHLKIYDEVTLLDIGSHLGLWTIRIAERCKFLGLKFKGYLYEPSESNIECLTENVKEFEVELFNKVVADHDLYMRPVETYNHGSYDRFLFDTDFSGSFVSHEIPCHELKGSKIIILPCMSTDFDILKLFDKTYLQEDVLIVAQLIEKNLARNGHTREEVISFLEQRDFSWRRYDLNFGHLDPHLEHTYFIFSK